MHTLRADELFRTAFARLYPPGADLDELRRTDANPAGNPAIFAKLEELAATFARLAPAALHEPGTADLALALDDASVHRVAARIDRARRDAWLAEVDDSGVSRLAVLTLHGAVWTGACIVATRPARARWLVRNPLWESRVRLESAAGVGELAPFMWWLKSLADEEVDKTALSARYRTHVEVPTFDGDALAVIAPPDRRFPRLAKARYDALFRHLKAHAPEIRSVGEDFPSPARMDELGFAWIEGRWLGGGRMLLLHGPTKTGTMAMWLSIDGFVKSAYFEGDRGAPHVVDVDGDKLRFIVQVGGKSVVHEMLWWGA